MFSLLYVRKITYYRNSENAIEYHSLRAPATRNEITLKIVDENRWTDALKTSLGKAN